MTLNETRVPGGTSLNVISVPVRRHRLQRNAGETPPTRVDVRGADARHARGGGGGQIRSRVVDPRNTIRTVAAVWFEEGVGDAGVSLHAAGVRLAMVTIARSIVRT